MKVLVWRKDPRAKLPERGTSESIGYDLFALVDVKFAPKEFKLVRTGLVIKAEPPYGLFIFPRSSLFIKKGLIMTNSVGIIDFDYCGENDELMVPLLNLREESVEVRAGEKIAQMVFINVAFPEIVEVLEPQTTSSRGGFGSTGGYKGGA